MTEQASINTNSAAPELTDSTGRKLVLRELGILEEADIARMVGDSATNQGYMMGYVIPSVQVASIDGDAVPVPATERELRFTIQRVGRAGIAAVHAHMVAKLNAANGGFDAEARAVKN